MRSRRMRIIRVWLPAAIIAAGLILIIARRDDIGAEGGALLISAGLSVWLLNWMYRISVRGDRDRDAEDRAREFYDRHGYWPDDEPPQRPKGRRP